MTGDSGPINRELKLKQAIDRDNALLTKRQREVMLRDALTGEERDARDLDLDDGNVRAHRSKARRRLRDSICDLWIASDYFHPDELAGIRQLLKKDDSELEPEEIAEKEMLVEGIQGMLKLAYEFEDVGDMPRIDTALAGVATEYHQRRQSHMVNGDFEYNFTVNVDIYETPDDYDLAELVEKAEKEVDSLTGEEKAILSYYLREREQFRSMAEAAVGEGRIEYIMDQITTGRVD